MKIAASALLFGLSIASAHAREKVPAFLVGDWSSQEQFTLQVRSNGLGEAWLGSADAMGIFLYDGYYAPSKHTLYFRAGAVPIHFKYDPKTKTLMGDPAGWKNSSYKCTQPLTRGPALLPPPVAPSTHLNRPESVEIPITEPKPAQR